MVHFRTRKDLITWLEQHCTRKAVVRAMQEGTVEHLGAFTQLGPNGGPGWIVRVTSDRGRVWIVEVIVGRFRCGIYICDASPDIPWQYRYAPGDSPPELYDGDNPVEYARLRDEQRQKITSEDLSSGTANRKIETDNSRPQED